jgi:flagellar assembly protein FliH
MRRWRSHRFPPLSGAMATGGFAPPLAQASMEEGFEQGLEQGHREGFTAGAREGREGGFRQGHEEGLKQGAAAARREVQQHFEQLAAPVEALQAALAQLESDYHAAQRKEVIELVQKVARQVIRCELALQPAQLLTLADETLATMPRGPETKVEVYLNDGDLQRIREVDEERAARWNLFSDPGLAPGECRVRSGKLEADAGCRQRLAACMEQISEQLLPAQSEDLCEAMPREAAA